MSLAEKLVSGNKGLMPEIMYNMPSGTFNPSSSQIEMNAMGMGHLPNMHTRDNTPMYAPKPETTCLGGIVNPSPFTGGYALPESGANLSIHGDCAMSHFKPFGESAMLPTLNAQQTAMADLYAKNIGLKGYGNPR